MNNDDARGLWRKPGCYPGRSKLSQRITTIIRPLISHLALRCNKVFQDKDLLRIAIPAGRLADSNDIPRPTSHNVGRDGDCLSDNNCTLFVSKELITHQHALLTGIWPPIRPLHFCMFLYLLMALSSRNGGILSCTLIRYRSCRPSLLCRCDET
jgi:hypothetical protein